MSGQDSHLAEIDAVQRALAPAAAGPVRIRVGLAEEEGRAVALIHVFDAYDCKGTEAEITGLLRGAALPWRIVWH
jgi:hypothetical protein